ncbi:MAG TPA: SRPBCC family protein [Longimicrobiaceae bacterium]|jgi:ligand-binding SRPBCC domain-containing protein|nr:SRPBCC family protein [Longimicrobiaceae bacterium]
MPVIRIEVWVDAPPERCFDLSRSIDLHVHTSAATGETAVAGRTSGLIGLGEEVTWRARHLGVWQRLTTRITELDRPARFRDSMVRGAFARFDHDHWFEPSGGGTLMRETFDYAAPLGPLGRLAERIFLTRYMRAFLTGRAATIKRVAESEEWRRFLAE